MNMAVNKSRNRISSLRINFFHTLILSDSCDFISAKSDIALLDLSGKNIHYLTVLDHRVCWDSSRCCVDQFF